LLGWCIWDEEMPSRALLPIRKNLLLGKMKILGEKVITGDTDLQVLLMDCEDLSEILDFINPDLFDYSWHELVDFRNKDYRSDSGWYYLSDVDQQLVHEKIEGIFKALWEMK
jgi:hypothetical protein